MKKSLTLLTILSLIANMAVAQTLSNLDLKYGMNKFRLESSYSTYQANLKLTLDGKVKYYEYTGSDISSIFDCKIKKIILGFYKNKLYYIKFDLNEEYPLYVDLIYDKLEQLFGPTPINTDIKKGPLTYKFAYVWQTKKTYLSFDEKLPNDLQVGSTAIWMYSNILGNQIASNDF